ncbi:hypothetical protein ACFWGI_06365 [Streptomyces niveus]|uniref:hypothetical protein n=1 Tax=Streptomyces niveus TaxID=193462 RepID=UPI0036692A14
MSERTRRTSAAAAGEESELVSAPKRKTTADTKHILVPDLDLGGDDDDDDDDDTEFLRSLGRAQEASQSSPTIPPQAEGKSKPAAASESDTAAPEDVALDAGWSPTASTSPPEPDAPGFGGSDLGEAEAPTSEQLGVVAEGPSGAIAVHKAGEAGEASPLGEPEPEEAATPGLAAGVDPKRLEEESGQTPGGALERSNPVGAGSRGATGTATEVYGGSVGSGVQVRRPGRRRHREPYDPKRPRDNGVAAMQEMVERAPRYAALLSVYSAAQTKTMPFTERNLHLYGLTADDAGLQGVADKAFLKTLTTTEPKLTIAHYADAALEPVLARFNPEGTDREAMEDERDYLWQLAQNALEFRRYVLSDPQTSRMPKYRAKGMLREGVNDRFSRMLNLMDSLAGIDAKPFEIVSSILADYLRKLPEEREGLKEVFAKHVVSTIQ